MEIKSHNLNPINIAEILHEGKLIETAEDGIELLGNLYYQGFDHVIIHEKNIAPTFFDLKTGIAGEVLQKFSTYRVKLAIVGDFSTYNSASLDAFIYESNKNKQINFVDSINSALDIFTLH